MASSSKTNTTKPKAPAKAKPVVKKTVPVKAKPVAKKVPVVAKAKPVAKAVPVKAKSNGKTKPAATEIKLTPIAKGEYGEQPNVREKKLTAFAKNLKYMLSVVQKSGQPLATSSFPLISSRDSRPAAKYGFRTGQARLYRGEDNKLYIGEPGGSAVKSVQVGGSTRKAGKPVSVPDDEQKLRTTASKEEAEALL